MSNPVKVKDAVLEGWMGPFFPKELTTFMQALAKLYKDEDANYAWDVFRSRVEALPEVTPIAFGEYPNYKTSDSYVWLYGIRYRIGRARSLLLIPDRSQGSFDRSCAIYCFYEQRKKETRILLGTTTSMLNNIVKGLAEERHNTFS